MASSSETGLQLFARLISRPSLLGLDTILFPIGPNPREVIELSGGPSCGKTLLFSQFIVRCILPKEFKNIKIGGLKSGVVLLNTDHHFQIYKLISLIQNHLQAVDKSCAVSEVEVVVKESLDRLIIYNITDSVQMQVTFYALQATISTHPEVGLILLDSVCAFYWQDVMGSGIRKMDLYEKTVIKNLQKSLGDFKGVIMYTKPSYFHSKLGKREACVAEPSIGAVNQRITLTHTSQDGEKNLFSAKVESPSGNFIKFYSIDGAGVQWLDAS